MKVVKKSRAKLPVEDIEKEILVMRQVDHPHIVRLFDWYEDSNKIYLVLEALKGGTLRNVILELQRQRKGLREDWIRSVLLQSIEAMAYVHSLRLIHKDLKDENIMLLREDADASSHEPFVIIIDLGIAEMFSHADPTGLECGGTPVTMAPEVWKGNFGPKCDVWSLGCVLFEMLAGAMPFMAGSMEPKEWLQLHRKGPDWTLVRSSVQGKALCKNMLSYREDRRPSMTQCLKHEWFDLEQRSLSSIAVNQFMPLQSFCHEVALKRSILLELASRLPMSKAGPIVALFEAFDTDRDGTLTLCELKTAFAKMGMTDEALATKIFRALDVNKDGFLSFSEFAAGTLFIFKDILDDRLHALFQEHDADGNGLLDIAETEAFLANAALLLKDGSEGGRSSEVLHELLQSGRKAMRYEDVRDKILGHILGPMAAPKSASARATSAGSR